MTELENMVLALLPVQPDEFEVREDEPSGNQRVVLLTVDGRTHRGVGSDLPVAAQRACDQARPHVRRKQWAVGDAGQQ